MDAKNHYAWECSICDETWPTEEELDEHYIVDHNWCESCDRYFQNENNVRMVQTATETPFSKEKFADTF